MLVFVSGDVLAVRPLCGLEEGTGICSPLAVASRIASTDSGLGALGLCAPGRAAARVVDDDAAAAELGRDVERILFEKKIKKFFLLRERERAKLIAGTDGGLRYSREFESWDVTSEEREAANYKRLFWRRPKKKISEHLILSLSLTGLLQLP